MKKMILPLLFLMITQISKAQDYRRNAVYVELGGNALLYSINYENRFADHWSGRLGLGYISGKGSGVNSSGQPTDVSVGVVFIPVMINYLAGNGKNGRFELGAGPLLVSAGANSKVGGQEINQSGFGIGGLTTTVGYRLQPLDGGFMFKIGITPLILTSATEPFQMWGGLSLGYCF